jgi:hypothetical protein
MKFKKTILSAVFGTALGFGMNAQAAVITLTFADNATPTAAPLPYTVSALGCGAPYTSAFTANNEFRSISYGYGGCAPNGGDGGMKSLFTGNGSEQWIFDNATGEMTGTAGFPGNPGIDPYLSGSAAPLPGTNPTVGQDFLFYGQPYYFLAPTTTSLTGAAYGPATISLTAGDSFSVLFPVLEGQWGGTYFPLANVNFQCTGALSGTFTCFAEHLLTNAEDPGYSGVGPYDVYQWELHGTLTQPVPIPAAIWLFGSGLLGLVGVARRCKVA